MTEEYTNHVIVYPKDEGGIAIIYVAPQCDIPVREIARKDVPPGKPFLIVHDDYTPRDHTFFDAFEADFTTPDGYGIGHNAWFIEQYEAKIATLNPAVDVDAELIAQLQNMIQVQQTEMAQLAGVQQ